MENCKRQSDKHFFVIISLWSKKVVIPFLLLLCHAAHHTTNAHYIQIDHNEFRASGFPRPVLPPPLPPIEQLPQHLPTAKELTPAEFMVDLTNDLTYRILHYHSILNRNNFAFSPTALMSVLVALYEGSAGRSSQELKNVLQLPNNKDVIRVGYRDIHRRLRTYFFGSENPLKGLSLNKDNVTILRDYETVLMFYGYDLGMDMVSSIATTTMPPIELTPPMTVATASEETTTKSTTAEVTTNLPETEVTTEAQKETTVGETTMVETTTQAQEETTTTTTEKPTTTTTIPETTITEEVIITTTTTPETEAETTPESEAESETEKVETEEAAELVSAFVAEEESEPFLRIEKARVTMLPSGRLQAPPKPQQKLASMKQKPLQATLSPAKKVNTTRNATQQSPSTSSASASSRLAKQQKSSRPSNATTITPKPAIKIQKLARQSIASSSIPGNNYLPATSRTFQSERISVRQARQRRHLFGSFRETDANLFVTLFRPQSQPPPTPHHSLYTTITGPGSSGPGILTHAHNEFEVEIEPHFITSSGNGGFTGATETKQNYNTDIISHIFYLGNQDVIYTTYKVYNAVLYYKYFEHLKMNVLELELDTPEYNLMILLPDYHTDLVAAAASLRLGPTLRLLRKQLKPRWVQAIIPDFKLQGAMFLTNDLQNLGICDIFEPNRADFRPMTDEKGIYVKHIEQSINVNIRTHPINQLKRNYGAPQLQPIQISVNHPFLFYIIDRDLDVAVMAGRILNPLNVRIQ